MLAKVQKGQFLTVKAPPYYKTEYLYQVTSAGCQIIRAALFHSPTVRKSWKHDEFMLLIEMGVIKLIEEDQSL